MTSPALTDADLAAVLTLINSWVDSKRSLSGSLNTNVMTVGMIVSERLSEAFPIKDSSIRTARGQVKGLSGESVSRMLQKFGETRPFTSEGGRTSRGSMGLALELTSILNSHGPVSLSEAGSRAQLAENLQEWFVHLIQREYFDKKRITADIDSGKPAPQAIALLLESAAGRGGNVAGAVAQHLVGAKLALRFPEFKIGNDGYTTADQQTSRAGDFQVKDTVFHVTMSPGERLLSGRCRDNIRNHFRPVVLVPDNKVLAARQIADMAGVLTDMSIIAIETFVGLNVEEMADFSTSKIPRALRLLLETYNARVGRVETDPSLLIDIPANL